MLARCGWTQFFQHSHHHHIKSINPHIADIPHPAAPYLARLARHGVPAWCIDPPWSNHQQDAAILRGTHPSARRQYADFILAEMFDYAQMGFWLVLPYSALRGHPRLKIAPAGVVPQRERRPRPIMDYTFNEVNQASVPLAPFHAMQFGSAFQRLLQRLAYCNPSFGPPVMAKIDLADGYYRIPLSSDAALQLAVCLPPDGDEEPLLGIPLSLPMGWSLSPPYFCSFTETCADLTNSVPVLLPTHPYQDATVPQLDLPLQTTFHPAALFPHNSRPPPAPLSYADVYIDDFMLIAQPPAHERVMHNLLHHIHSVFKDPPSSPRRAVVSASKIGKGDATFSTQKTLLGWLVDSHTMTVHLPPHRVQRLEALLTSTLDSTYTTRRRWQRLLGELHSMVPAIHSAKFLFSILHHHLATHHQRRKRLTTLPRQALRDWMHLLHHLGSTPVPIAHLVPQPPHVVAATDASREGMGGFWLPTMSHEDSAPYAWRYAWPEHVKQRLVSTVNPSGDLSINDLELAAIITASGTQIAHTPNILNHSHTCIATDNTAAHAWVTKGSPTSTTAPAFLLRQLAWDCRRQDVSIQTVHTSGSSNTVADLLSRSFALSDSELLAALSRAAPSQRPWRLVTPPAATISTVSLALSRKFPQTGSPSHNKGPTTPHGLSGPSSARSCTVTPSYRTSTNPCPYSRSSLTDTEWEPWLPLALRSKLEQWNQPFVPLGRRWPHWAITTPGSNSPVNSTYGCIANYRHTLRKTHRQPGSNPFHSK